MDSHRRLYINPLFTLKNRSDITLTVFGLTSDAAAVTQIVKYPVTNHISLNISDIDRFFDAQNYASTFFIQANYSDGDTSQGGTIPVTITDSSFCDNYQSDQTSMTNMLKVTTNQVEIPFVINCLKTDTIFEEKFIQELEDRAMAVFSNIGNIVRIKVLEIRPIYEIDKTTKCRLGCSHQT